MIDKDTLIYMHNLIRRSRVTALQWSPKLGHVTVVSYIAEVTALGATAEDFKELAAWKESLPEESPPEAT